MFGRKRQRRGVFLWFVFGLLMLLILLALAMLLIPLAERGDRTAVDGSADWMARLDDGLPLNRLDLPGTHDSATRYVQLAFFSKCQGLSIQEQLEAGYRYLDIRLGTDAQDSRLKLMHGFTNCKTTAGPQSDILYLEELLQQCYAFLAEHPTEAVVFAVKQEHGDLSVADFETQLDACIQKNEAMWLLSDRIPSLGEARGKLVLMRRYPDEAGLGDRAGIPLLWADQPGSEDTGLNTAANDNGAYTLWVQDRYEYGGAAKWAAFLAGMDNDAGVKDISLNFLSTKGTLLYGHPWYFARSLNARLAAKELPADRFYGWIVVDFGSAPLAKHIYAANFG